MSPVDRPSLMERALGALPLGVAYTVEGVVVYANPALCELMGGAVEDIVGRPFLEFIDPADRAMVAARYQARLAGARVPESYEIRHNRMDGRTIRLEVDVRTLGNRDVVVVLRDVTDRVRDSALVVALTELAARLQPSRDVDGVLEVACKGLLELGLSASAMQKLETGYVIRFVAMPEEMAAGFTSVIGPPSLKGLHFHDEEDPILGPILLSRKAAYFDDLGPLVRRFLATLEVPEDLDGLKGGDRGRIVIAPLIVHDRPWGALAVSSPTLSGADAAAIGLFAAQVAASLEVIGSLDDLERTHRDLAAIHAVAQATGEQDLGSHLPQLARIAADATVSDLCALYLFNEERFEFELGASHGRPEEIAGVPRHLSLRSTVTGNVALSTMPRALTTEDQPPGLREQLAPLGQSQWAIIPLQIKGRLAGAIHLGRRENRPFREAELHMAGLLGAQLAIQVENARLYADAHRRVRLLSVLFSLGRLGSEVTEISPLADRVVALVGSALNADQAVLYMVKSEKLVLVGHRSSEERAPELPEVALDRSTLFGRAALDRRTLLDLLSEGDPKDGQARHAAAVPLVASDRLVGVMCAMRPTERPFADEEIKLLELSAAQTAIALEHAHLFEQARQRVDDLRLLLDVGRVISASLDLGQILEEAAAILTQLIDASNCFILLVEEGSGQLRGVASSNPRWREQFRTVRLSTTEPSLAARAVLTGAAIAVSDAASSPDVARALVELYGEKSVVAIPIMARDKAIGCVVIDDTRRVREWTAAEIERATLIGNQVGVAIVNARLYEDLKRSYADLAKAQQELVKRERLAALGELAAVVAHEVRNPVAVVFNALSSLRKILRPTGDAAMLLAIVGEEADRLNRIVGDLLDFARPNEPAIATEPLADVIADSLEAAVSEPQANRVEIRTVLDQHLPPVRIDARMVRQALLNVLLNGMQAMPKGGILTIRAVHERGSDRSYARVDISDTGPGIPPEVVSLIFQPFFTTKATGTGLGLAVVKRIVEAHHGEVMVESLPGTGTTVSLRLPIADGE